MALMGRLYSASRLKSWFSSLILGRSSIDSNEGERDKVHDTLSNRV